MTPLDINDPSTWGSFVGGMIRRTFPRYNRDEYDDLVAYGYVGLLEARKRFDPARGVQFHSFAWWRVHGAIVDGMRQMSGATAHYPIPVVRVGTEVATDDKPSVEQTVVRRDLVRVALRLVERMPERDQAVVLRHARGDMQTEIAADLDLSKGWVSRLQSQAFAKVRKQIEPAAAARSMAG